MFGFVVAFAFGFVFGSCPVRVWLVFGSCLVRVRFVSGFMSGTCLVPVRLVFGFAVRIWVRVSGSWLVGVWFVFGFYFLGSCLVRDWVRIGVRV